MVPLQVITITFNLSFPGNSPLGIPVWITWQNTTKFTLDVLEVIQKQYSHSLLMQTPQKEDVEKRCEHYSVSMNWPTNTCPLYKLDKI